MIAELIKREQGRILLTMSFIYSLEVSLLLGIIPILAIVVISNGVTNGLLTSTAEDNYSLISTATLLLCGINIILSNFSFRRGPMKNG